MKPVMPQVLSVTAILLPASPQLGSSPFISLPKPPAFHVVSPPKLETQQKKQPSDALKPIQSSPAVLPIIPKPVAISSIPFPIQQPVIPPNPIHHFFEDSACQLAEREQWRRLQGLSPQEAMHKRCTT